MPVPRIKTLKSQQSLARACNISAIAGPPDVKAGDFARILRYREAHQGPTDAIDCLRVRAPGPGH